MKGSMTGRVFNNRYQITDRVGLGGMAEVYQAEDKVLGRRVAVKVMLPQYAADPDFTRRFRQEAASAANLSSPYIVSVYDWGQDNGTYYIVMEYVRGSDLKTAIQQRGPVNQRKVAEIGSQVCQALSVAHSQGIIHRDIKPQNIMIQPDGNIKVMDFGIARAKNSVEQHTSSVLGTAHYISPEQAQGKELDSMSDLYSLGIVLYESCTGKLPFDGPDAVSVATKQVNEYPALPSEINPDIDPALESIIMRALEKDPAARFTSALEMKQALNDYLAGRSTNYARQKTAYMPPVISPSNSGNIRPVVVDDEQDKKKGKGKGKIIALLIAILLVAGGLCAFAYYTSSKSTVPDVSGLTVSEATKKIENAGFEVGTQTQVYSEKVDKGLVVSTDPESGTLAKAGSSVNLLISQGQETATVPDLSDMTADEARAALKKVGLNAKAGTSEYSDTVKKDKVMSQNPEAGETVNVGETVTYVISLGPEGIEVPDVVGKSEGNATAELKNAGFEVESVDTEYSESVPEGCVISQTPEAGETLAKGKTVSLVISLGSQSYNVSGSVSPAAGGSITVSNTSVNYGGSVSYSISVNSGYTIASVTDNYGASYGTAASGTITGITADTTIFVQLNQTGTNNTTTQSTG